MTEEDVRVRLELAGAGRHAQRLLARGWRDEVLGCELASTQESTESAEFTRLDEPPGEE